MLGHDDDRVAAAQHIVAARDEDLAIAINARQQQIPLQRQRHDGLADDRIIGRGAEFNRLGAVVKQVMIDSVVM